MSFCAHCIADRPFTLVEVHGRLIRLCAYCRSWLESTGEFPKLPPVTTITVCSSLSRPPLLEEMERMDFSRP